MSADSERAGDQARVEEAVKGLRTVLRLIDRELKNAQDGGLTVDDAHALRALTTRAEHASTTASDILRHVIVREQGRLQREGRA